MCRVLGCVASEPVSLRHELLEAENPMIRQSEEHDSGWGIAVYRRAEGEQPTCMRFPQAAYQDLSFRTATDSRGRIFNAHVRRATMGGLTSENTHPFCLGNYSFSHNGTVLNFTRLLGDGARPPAGQTDSEHLFNFMMRDFDPGDVIASLRRGVERTVHLSTFSGLNFLFSDGERLYAYRLGLFELHWLARPGQLLVASERLTEGEQWHSVQQDVLLVLDPQDVEEPHAERLVGDEVVARAHIQKFHDGLELQGAERGRFAAERAARMGAPAAG
jgi:predicted glutamine amidotransferase